MAIQQQPRQKSFFAKYWWAFVGGAALILIALAVAAVLVYLYVLKGEAKVTDLSLSAGNVAYGEKIEAVVTLVNDRVLAAEFTGSLTVDGKEQALKETQVDAGETVKVKYDLSKLEPGSHKISIGDLNKEFKILRPAEFKVKGLTVDPIEGVLVGSTVQITAAVQNTGEVKGTYQATFTHDGIELDPQSVDVAPGGEQTVSLSFTVAANGAHEIAIEGQKQAYTAYNPANIAPVDLQLAATLAKPGEKIDMTVVLANSGDIAGNYPLQVIVNGESAYTEEIAVEGGKQVEVPLSITEDKAGAYVIQVGDLQQTLTVAVITRPASGTLLAKAANSGRCTLTVQNNYTDRDALIILASTSEPKKQLLAFYVRAGEKTKKIKVKDGSYIIYQMTGTNFDSATKKFLTDARYIKYDETLVTKTTKTYSQIKWTDFSLTLYAQDGNATTTQVDEGNFPQ